MTFALIALAIFLMVLVGFFVLSPAWSKKSSSGLESPDFLIELESLLHLREQKLLNLTDLEQDLQLGKISPSDYETLRNDALAEAASCYQEIENLEIKNEFLREIRMKLEQRATQKKGTEI